MMFLLLLADDKATIAADKDDAFGDFGVVLGVCCLD
jgi:hypothetical protein